MRFRYKKKMFDIEGVSESEHIYRQIVKQRKFYEIDLLKYIFAIRSFINNKFFQNIVIDVGANIGNHSIFFSSFLADHVIVIEPNRKVIPVLKRNLKNNVSNYTLFECGVGDKECKGTIIIDDNNENNVGMAKLDVKNSKGNVEIFTLDAIFNKWLSSYDKNVSISLIKVDVEGMELPVLKGAEDLLKKHKPHIFVEAISADELNKISGFLTAFGYKKMPGHLSATPVYHFLHNSSFKIFAFSYYGQVKRLIREALFKIFYVIKISLLKAVSRNLYS